MVGALTNSQKVLIFEIFSPYKKNPFQSGPNSKIAKKCIFQHFSQEMEGRRTCSIDNAIQHINIDLIPVVCIFFV